MPLALEWLRIAVVLGIFYLVIYYLNATLLSSIGEGEWRFAEGWDDLIEHISFD